MNFNIFFDPVIKNLIFLESVKSLLGKHVKILLKTVVKLETKPDKLENRVLVCHYLCTLMYCLFKKSRFIKLFTLIFLLFSFLILIRY